MMRGGAERRQVIIMTGYNSALLLSLTVAIYDLHCKYDIVWDLVTVPDQTYNHQSVLTPD